MATDFDPLLECWYRHLDKGQEFRVIALDETAGTVEVQYFDGSIESLEIDAWYEMDIEAIEPPENWSGALEFSEADDLGVGITDTTDEDWREPQEEIRHPDERAPLIEPEEADDWEEGRPQEEPSEREP